MREKTEPVNLSIKRMQLTDVVLEGLNPLDVAALAKDIENTMDEIANDRNLVDSYKIALYALLFYAGKAYTKDHTAQRRSKAEEKQLDSAIDKLTLALESLPLK